MKINIGDCVISDDKSLLQPERINAMLAATYWADKRPAEVTQNAIDNSVCFGVYCNDMQIGFARCVTDFATTYYLCDVVVDEEYRGNGVGKALVEYITGYKNFPHLIGLLWTRDAHGLYAQYGFKDFQGMYRWPE